MASPSKDDRDSSNNDEENFNISGQLMSGSRLTSQSRNIILNVLEFFTFGGLFKTLKDITKATAEATKVPERTVKRIKCEKMKSDGKIRSPLPRKRKSSVVESLDNFDKECVRREVLSFYERGDIPTLSNLLPKVKEPPINF